MYPTNWLRFEDLYHGWTRNLCLYFANETVLTTTQSRPTFPKIGPPFANYVTRQHLLWDQPRETFLRTYPLNSTILNNSGVLIMLYAQTASEYLICSPMGPQPLSLTLLRPICSIPILPLVSPSLIHHQILSIQVQSHQPPACPLSLALVRRLLAS